MKVYVTHEQVAIREEKMRADITGDRTKLVGLLSACTLDNGGDLNAALALAGAETEIVIVPPSTD